MALLKTTALCLALQAQRHKHGGRDESVGLPELLLKSSSPHTMAEMSTDIARPHHQQQLRKRAYICKASKPSIATSMHGIVFRALYILRRLHETTLPSLHNKAACVFS